MAKIKFRTVYSAREEEHNGILFPSDSLAQQQFRDECDVNRIVDRYVKTGVLEHLSEVTPQYGDVTEVPIDLMAAYDAVGRAEEAFMQLPSQLRKELDNDPSRLSAWLRDENNRETAVRYGLMNVPAPAIDKTNVEKPPEPSNDNVSA